VNAYQALTQGAALHVHQGWGLLEVRGPDRLEFVHNQCTSPIKTLPPQGVSPTLFLNNRGQIEYMATVLNLDNRLWLWTPPGQATELAARFRKYIVFDQVELELIDEPLSFRVQGPLLTAASWPWTHPQTNRLAEDQGAVFFGDAQGLVAVGPATHTGPLLHQLAHLSQATPEDWEIYTLEQGWPGPSEATGQLPQECGLEERVSYRKGCYLGQEIMARLEARGQTRYQLMGVKGDGLEAGTELMQGQRIVGRVGRVAQSARLGRIGLAVVRKDLTSDPLRVALPAQPAITLCPLPFV
jgi:folate-binding protein YgfZ